MDLPHNKTENDCPSLSLWLFVGVLHRFASLFTTGILVGENFGNPGLVAFGDCNLITAGWKVATLCISKWNHHSQCPGNSYERYWNWSNLYHRNENFWWFLSLRGRYTFWVAHFCVLLSSVHFWSYKSRSVNTLILWFSLWDWWPHRPGALASPRNRYM